MMDIIDHGEWETYKPESYPIRLPPNVIFARRVSDGRDWYQFQREELTSSDTIKVTALKTDVGWMVLATTSDATAIFPAGTRLLEVRGATEDHESFRMKRIDFERKRFVPPPPPPPSMVEVLMEELGLDKTEMQAKLDAARLKNRR